MQAVLVNDALTMAIWKRKLEKGLIWHTDRGSQYASDSHRLFAATWHCEKREPQGGLLGQRGGGKFFSTA